MDQRKKIGMNMIGIIVILLLIFTITKIYQKYNFGAYEKTEYIRNGSQFERDSNVKYGKTNSYRIDSPDYNDAVFYQTIKVEPHTPYRVSCMVKTQEVQSQETVSNAGAGICIVGTVEQSSMITQTADWQKIELLFDSKNREEVEIGFRLGSYEDNAKGTAWFSDFQLESGIVNTDTQWQFATFIFKNVDVTVDKEGKQTKVKLSMDQDDIGIMEENIRRFEESIRSLSGYQMSAKATTYVIEEPITSLSYDETNGYYVDPKNVQEILKKYLTKQEYDHIFVAVRLGDVMEQKEIPVNDWIGLRSYG